MLFFVNNALASLSDSHTSPDCPAENLQESILTPAIHFSD